MQFQKFQYHVKKSVTAQWCVSHSDLKNFFLSWMKNFLLDL